MTKAISSIQVRREGEIVPDGVSFTKAARLHVVYQERRGDEVFRFRIAIPFPDHMFGDDLPDQCYAETECE